MSSANRHIAILCNPLSGKGKPLKLLPEFVAYLTLHNFQHTVFRGELPALVAPFTDVVIMGGDGSVNYILNHYRNIPLPVSIIPCGTGNDIAFALLGKKDALHYFDKAINGIPTQVDAGTCNEKLFLNGTGIGFEGWVVRRLLAKRFFTGIAAYYSTVVSLLLFYRESKVKVTIDNQTQTIPLFMFSAANGPTVGGGFHVAPGATFHDGEFDFLTVQKINLFNRIKYLPLIEKGKHLEKEETFIDFRRGKKARLESDQPLQAHLDGEWIESPVFEIGILPAHLKIRI